jgi:hypothetical protein
MDEDEESFDNQRRNQIQTEVNEFYDKLELAAKRYADTSQDELSESLKNSRSSSPSLSPFHKKMKKKLVIVSDL